ncbi:unnamed protein product [Angiostrongylus costaricensis]|uniref:Olfactomedin-like domain-containing protein n=1 Tax=Angiostrongylus costaricensis TaxID=334426 RepID=A0A0R3PV01_ANGCS|nr:unnamed protein product [Angiostrongylus costaricensis]
MDDIAGKLAPLPEAISARVPRWVVIAQIGNLFLLIVFYLHAYITIIVANSLCQKDVLERSCSRIHRHCSDIGMKLMGFQGARGDPGLPGPVGPPGKCLLICVKIRYIGILKSVSKLGRCNCTFPNMYVHRIPIPGPPVIQVEEKMVPVPVVVVKEVEVTRLVPFEPTPPGFGPPPGWSPGMPKPDLSKTRKLSRFYIFSTVTTTLTPRSTRRRRPTTPKYFVPPVFGENGTLLFGNFTDTWGNYTNFTTPEPYTGPPTLGYNRRECMLAAVGIPVLHAESQYGEVGSWMRDAHPQSDYMAEKRWVTDGYASPVLYEYENERQMMNKVQNIKYYVDYLASGTGNLVYNGSYYYHKHGSTALVRYDLETTDQIEAELGDIAHRDCGRLPDHTFEVYSLVQPNVIGECDVSGLNLTPSQLNPHHFDLLLKDCNETERHPWLYSRPHNYVDFAADENGLWVIYMRPDSYSLYVSKIEPDFYIVDTWEVPDVNGTELADAFIMCGVLYGLQSATTRDSRISLAYDLFSNETIPGQVAWYNPYQGLTMLHYNPVDSRLYFFDDRRLLSVNVRMDDDEPDYEN